MIPSSIASHMMARAAKGMLSALPARNQRLRPLSRLGARGGTGLRSEAKTFEQLFLHHHGVERPRLMGFLTETEVRMTTTQMPSGREARKLGKAKRKRHT